MWFFFGLISLVLFAIVTFRHRYRARWKGERRSFRGVPFELRIWKNRGSLAGIDGGVFGAGPFTFKLVREGDGSRLAKAIGLSVELQVGDPEFDECVYVVSDDPLFCRTLKKGPALRERILTLFRMGEGIRLIELHCAGGRLWGRFSILQAGDDAAASEALARTVPTLRAIADALAQVEVRASDHLRDPFVRRAAVVLACSTALFLYGMLSLFRPLFDRPEATLVPNEALVTSLAISVPLWGGLIAATVYFLGRSARAHIVLLEVLVMGGVGAFLSGYSLAKDLNVALDRAPAQEVRVPVARHERVLARDHRGRQRTRHYLHVRDWTGEAGLRKLSVKWDLYEDSVRAGELRLLVREGGLGMPWLEEIEPVPRAHVATP